MTAGSGFDGGTGRYRQVLKTGRDGRGRFCRRDRAVGAGFADGTGRYGDVSSTGRDGKVQPERFSRRDGTVRVNGRQNCRRDGTGRDHGFFLTTVLPSRSVLYLPSIRSRQ